MKPRIMGIKEFGVLIDEIKDLVTSGNSIEGSFEYEAVGDGTLEVMGSFRATDGSGQGNLILIGEK